MTHGKGWAFVDGRVVPLEEARVPVTDRGFLLGDGVFETMRARDARVFRWDLHRQRLAAGLRTIGIDASAADEAEAAVAALMDAAASAGAPSELYVRVQVVRPATLAEPEDSGGVTTALARPMMPYPEALRRRGVRLATASWRKATSDPLSTVKHMSYLPYLMARRQARAAGADDALILNDQGRPCEASHSNVIALVDGRVHAPGPSEAALDGVTRRVLLDALTADGAHVQEPLTAAELARAEEVVLTNTIGGVVSVTSIDDRAVIGGEGARSLARRLAQAYEDALREA